MKPAPGQFYISANGANQSYAWLLTSTQCYYRDQYLEVRRQRWTRESMQDTSFWAYVGTCPTREILG